ncbi:MAG: Fe-S cluster assembly protein SufD [Candidatus Omnitrophica bacterium]|nr:Fe-S cluster assembly protein SufD [Candidatus Omnitrophota bacterium]MDD5670745.1 Fe-S cluster assembly protein SufD [Candidatus Omnitrophota bacterium]
MNDKMTIQIGPDKKNYEDAFKIFESVSERETASWFREHKAAAISRVAQLDFPTRKNEDWKYTDVSPIVANTYRFPLKPAINDLPFARIEPFLFGQSDWPRLVFINGVFSGQLSQTAGLPSGVKVCNLREVLRTDNGFPRQQLNRYALPEKRIFTALNAAFTDEGACVYFPPGLEIQQPVHLIYVTVPSEDKILVHPRNLVIADKGARAAVIESFVSVSESAYFNNAVSEIVLEEGARLDYYKMIREGPSAFHIGTTEVCQHRSTLFSSCTINLGGRIARSDLHVDLAEEGAECSLDGLYLVTENQHVDNYILVDHPKPRGTSRQLYKGILDGKGTSVFYGKVFVHPDAQKTDAIQTNKNLLLTEGASAYTRPQFEIYADDVKCTHGAAVGQLDEEAVFYLKSRGIGEARARNLLCYGFASEVVNRIRQEPVRRELDRVMLAKFEEA